MKTLLLTKEAVYNVTISDFLRLDSFFMYAAVKRSVLNLLFSPRCPICGEPTETAGGLCPDCFSALDFLRPPFCPSCGRPVTREGMPACPACLDEKPFAFTVRSAVSYTDVSKKPVLSLKYRGDAEAGSLMARLMRQAGPDVLNGADVLLPVPLHRWRLLFRRFNQSVVLSREISGKTGVPTDAVALVRTRHTPKQGHFSKEKRFENVKSAFAVPKPDRVAGKTVVLIDDVMTTGATLSACADVLLDAGARQVRALTFARVIK